MEVLRARQEIKDEFRMRMTQFRPAENNPLKFSANVDDALHNLLVKRNAAYLGPVEAFADAFEDLRTSSDRDARRHAGGVRSDARRVRSRSPAEGVRPAGQDRRAAQRAGKAALLGPVSRPVREMVKDTEASFRGCSARSSREAYEEQLRRLKAADEPGPRGDEPPAYSLVATRVNRPAVAANCCRLRRIPCLPITG